MPGTKKHKVRIRFNQNCRAMPTVRKAANGGMKIAMMIRMISMEKPFNLIKFDVRYLSVSTLCWQVAFILSLILNFNVLAADWSETDPPINLTHVFEGEINKRGKPVGYHARYRGNDPENAQVIRLISGPNDQGIYTGEVEIYDEEVDHWKRKSFSSFFPDHLTKTEIQSLILKAYHGGKMNKKGRWQGKSGLGFSIQGWLCPKGGRPTCPDGAINTAYPLFKRGQ